MKQTKADAHCNNPKISSDEHSLAHLLVKFQLLKSSSSTASGATHTVDNFRLGFHLRVFCPLPASQNSNSCLFLLKLVIRLIPRDCQSEPDCLTGSQICYQLTKFKLTMRLCLKFSGLIHHLDTISPTQSELQEPPPVHQTRTY
jgi:hypothetical protein